MKLASLDEKLAQHYATQLTKPLMFGENAVFCWFPGSGMTTVLQDIFRSKKMLQATLGKLADSLQIVEVFGHVADKKTAYSALQEAGFASEAELRIHCQQLLAAGYELVFLVGRIDDFTDKEKLKLLKIFIKLNALNGRRVHILFNTIDKPWFEQALARNPELMVLANRLEIVPLLQDKLLMEYIAVRGKQYDFANLVDAQQQIATLYGGVLQLSKEYLRSQGDSRLVELKLKALWHVLPESYTSTLQEILSGQVPTNPDALRDLQNLGVLHLKLFERHKRILDLDSAVILPTLLTPAEQALWDYCQAHLGEIISKDKVTELLRPENASDISLWALDKAISRFRSKLAQSGIDPDKFKTLKKKGYLCEK